MFPDFIKAPAAHSAKEEPSGRLAALATMNRPAPVSSWLVADVVQDGRGKSPEERCKRTDSPICHFLHTSDAGHRD